MLTICIAASQIAFLNESELKIGYENRSGLRVSLGELEIVRGSFFQYYFGNWERGVYSSNWNNVEISRTGDAVIVKFAGDSRRVHGQARFVKTATGLRAEYTFGWQGDRPVNVENTVGLVWAEPFLSGRVAIDGKPARSPAERIAPGSDEVPRYFGAPARRVECIGDRIGLSFQSPDQPLRALDGIGFAQDWAARDDLFWVGNSRVEVAPGAEVSFTVDLKISAQQLGKPSPEVTEPIQMIADKVYLPPAPLMPTVTPRSMRIEKGSTALPKVAGLMGAAKQFSEAFWTSLKQHWQATEPKKPSEIDAKIVDSKAPSGSYSLRAAGNKIIVVAQDQSGLRFAAVALAELFGNRDGVVGLPQVEILDKPTVDWRGVHMFVGPTALEYQTRLMERVLVPSRINQVVLQCEQTDWKCMPKIRTNQTMAKEDLQRLVDRYRRNGIEPTPLIQSWGHMRWFFANQQNLDVAWNPKDAFGIDPRKIEARERVEKIWREAHALFKPKIMHFGLDEVDLNGMDKKPELLTSMWQDYVPWLSKFARGLGSKPMFWSDKALAVGEGPDACHAESLEHAKHRRAAIPTGAFIGDWHYKDDPNPRIYGSLDVWINDGKFPIATTWNRPGNIRGFIAAAASKGVGFLQSTWAGYTSSEAGMLREFSQIASYIYAGECGWRGSPLDTKLPLERLQQLYYGVPKAIAPIRGYRSSPSGKQRGSVLSDGTVQFESDRPLASLCYSLDKASATSPIACALDLSNPCTTIRVTLSCRARLAEGQPVGTITVTTTDNKRIVREIKYGYDVRCTRDQTPTSRTPRSNLGSVITLSSNAGKMKRIRFEQATDAVGLEINQLVAHD